MFDLSERREQIRRAMNIPTLLMIASAALLPLQHLSAVEVEPKKPTTTKKTTSKDKKSTKKTTPAKKKTTTKKTTPTKKATTPAKKETTTKKSTTAKKTTPAKKTTTTSKTASHISMASPELQKKAAAWVKALSSAKRTKLLGLLNKGKVEDFKDFPGVGPAKFTNMKKGRPFKTVDALANINGFGEATFKALVDHAKKMK